MNPTTDRGQKFLETSAHFRFLLTRVNPGKGIPRQSRLCHGGLPVARGNVPHCMCTGGNCTCPGNREATHRPSASLPEAGRCRRRCMLLAARAADARCQASLPAQRQPDLGVARLQRGRTAWHVVATGPCGWRCEACGFGPTGGTLPSTPSSWKSARAHLPSRTVGAAHGTRQLQRCRQAAAPSDCTGRPDRSRH